MADTTVLGRFLWHELMTTDSKAAQAFYPKVTGWKTQPWEQNADYILWVAKSGPVGGVMELSEATRSSGAKPHWLPYVGTPDIEGTLKEATNLGALVVVQVTGIPNGGKYAVVADPQGAMFGLYASPSATVPGSPKLGEFSWHELATADYRSAFSFYQALFGWQKVDEHDMGPMGIYFMFGFSGVPFGGMFNKPADMLSSWLNYALVRDAAKVAKAAKAAGGQVINGPMEVPGGDWITQILDPQGAAFAVHAKAAAAVPAPAESAADNAGAPATEPASSAPEPKPAPRPAKPKKAAVKAKAAAPAKKAAKKKASKKKAAKKAASKKVARKAAKKKSKPNKKKSVRRAPAKKKAAPKKKSSTKKRGAKKKAARKK